MNRAIGRMLGPLRWPGLCAAKVASALRLLGLCAVLLCSGLVHADEAAAQRAIRDEADLAFRLGDFARLEQLNRQYQRGDLVTPAGVSKLDSFRKGLGEVLNGPSQALDAYFTEIERLTLSWAIQHPESAFAHTLHARALLAHAYSYRGGGFANTVAPHAWEDFRKYANRAAQYMAAHSSVALADSGAHWTLISIGRALNWDIDKVLAIANDGLARNPNDDAIRFNVLTTLLPKWQGNARAVDRYINDVVAATKIEHGMAFYARLYSAAADDQFEHALFDDSGAEWPKLKAGYEDRLKRYPDPIYVNRYAYFACLARDKPTLLDLLERIADRPMLDWWGANGARTFETCKRWASQQ